MIGRFVMSREPVVVNHGPARTSPTTRSTKPTSSSRSWPADGTRFAGRVEVREQGDAGEQWDDPHDSGGGADARRFTSSVTLDPAKCEAGRNDSANGNADHTRRTLIQWSERSP